MTEGDNKIYEIAFLLESEEDLSVIMRQLTAQRAEILAEGAINKIKLAYPIKKQWEAYFGHLQFRLSPGDAIKLSEALKLEGKIIRFLIVSVVPKFQKKVPEPRKTEIKPKLEERPLERAPEAEISNEALEKKLEEILG